MIRTYHLRGRKDITFERSYLTLGGDSGNYV